MLRYTGTEIFANANDLRSASEVANAPQKYKKLKVAVQAHVGAQILDHRPHQEHGPPLDILCEAFAQFSQDVRTCLPSLGASRLVGKLVELASEVSIIVPHLCESNSPHQRVHTSWYTFKLCSCLRTNSQISDSHCWSC